MYFTFLITVIPLIIIPRKWIADAYQFWDDIRLTPEASLAGVTQLSGYLFSNTHKSVVQVRYRNDLHACSLKCTFTESLHRRCGAVVQRGDRRRITTVPGKLEVRFILHDDTHRVRTFPSLGHGSVQRHQRKDSVWENRVIE